MRYFTYGSYGILFRNLSIKNAVYKIHNVAIQLNGLLSFQIPQQLLVGSWPEAFNSPKEVFFWCNLGPFLRY